MDERIVVVNSGTGLRLTEEQMDERSAMATVQLRRRGVRTGDSVAVCLPVGPDLVVATMAVIAAGGVAWLLPPDLDTCTLRDHIRESSARVMISSERRALEVTDESHVRVVVGVTDLCEPRLHPA
jgi:acyl-coenzyme A synthetase/AMP-(fatty) acid ligase